MAARQGKFERPQWAECIDHAMSDATGGKRSFDAPIGKRRLTNDFAFGAFLPG